MDDVWRAGGVSEGTVNLPGLQVPGDQVPSQPGILITLTCCMQVSVSWERTQDHTRTTGASGGGRCGRDLRKGLEQLQVALSGRDTPRPRHNLCQDLDVSHCCNHLGIARQGKMSAVTS